MSYCVSVLEKSLVDGLRLFFVFCWINSYYAQDFSQNLRVQI